MTSQELFDRAIHEGARGRLGEAATLYKGLLKDLEPADGLYHPVRYNLSWFAYRDGDILQGATYRIESGRSIGLIIDAHHSYRKPRARTLADIVGKRVLLSNECGAGDEILNARYAKLLKARGASRILWVSRNGLESLLGRVEGIDEALTPERVREDMFDCWALTLDLPLILELTAEEARSAAYVSADPLFIQKWKEKLRPGSGLRVGLRWKGEESRDISQERSVPFEALERLVDLPGVDAYSLQRDRGAEERPAHSRVIDWGSGFSTWEDTAGAIANLDLVITSCTAVAHLSAAMGKETWVLCRQFCYYPWLGPEEGVSYWYESARVFREPIRGNWELPLARARIALEEKLAERPPEGPQRIEAQYPCGTMPMYIHPEAELVSEILRRQNWYSKNDLVLYDFFLQEGDCFVDAGANIGWFSLYAARRVGTGGTVIAVEPDARNYELLERNARLNALATMYLMKVALGERAGQATLYRSPQNFGDHFAGPGGYERTFGRGGESVPVITLDEALKEVDRAPDFIKIDVQGGEPALLRGSAQLLSHPEKPPMLIEFSPGLIRRSGEDPSFIVDFIEAHGYTAYHVIDDYYPTPGFRRMDRPALEGFAREMEGSEVGWDLILVPPQWGKRFEEHFAELIVDPAQGGVHAMKVNFIHMMNFQGRYDEAMAAADTLPPDFPRAKAERGWHLVRTGKFLEGMRLLQEEPGAWHAQPLYDLPEDKKYRPGMSLEGKVVLLVGEGGLGDEMMCARFAQVVEARGASEVVIGCSPELVQIFERVPGVDRALPKEEAARGAYDYWIAALNAPVVLGMNSPGEGIIVPYLSALPERVAEWKRFFAQHAGGRPVILIHWQGKGHGNRRDIPARELLPLGQQGALFALQRDERAHDLDGSGVMSLADRLTDWEETLAAIAAADYVVTSCTSIAHAAGALGAKTIILVHTYPYFPWAVQSASSEWYPSVRIFRQRILGAWGEPVAEAVNLIAQDSAEKKSGIRYVPIRNEESTIRELFKKLPVKHKYCVDLGAEDGEFLSNTLFLFENGWSGLAVEFADDKFEKLSRRYAQFKKAALSKTRVTPDNIVPLLRGFDVPEDFDFLSLDIDSYDFFVLDALLSSYRPTLICTEINETFPPPVKFSLKYDPSYEFSQDTGENPGRYYGYSIAKLGEILEKHKYVLLTLNLNNAFIAPREMVEALDLPGRLPTIEEAYQAGYVRRPDRLEFLPWNAEYDFLQSLPPQEVVRWTRQLFSAHKDQFECYTDSVSIAADTAPGQSA